MWHAIDFGTSNSLLCFVEAGKKPRLINLESNQPILKSLIFTPEPGEFYFGSEAIDKYQDLAGEGRFFRSLKKFLPEPGFKGTVIFEKRFEIEDLIAIFLKTMKGRAEIEVGKSVENVVLGRPALYSLDLKKDKLAEDRMLKAAKKAGYKRVEFCPEPVAAGLNVEGSESEKLVLICDFGGGTSDFTLLKTGGADVLGLSGVFVAGDAMDGRIMRDFISEHFGKNITYRAPMGKNLLRFPRPLLTKLCNPAHIAFLKEPETWNFLKELEVWSVGEEDQKYFDQLFCLVEEQLGYPVYAEIEKSKIALGEKEECRFSFKHPGIEISMSLKQPQFESAVEIELNSIFESLEKVFEQANIELSSVDEVRITGGTGQMPLIQKRLYELFGKNKIIQGEVYQSVVQGLGLYAQNINSL